MNKVWRQLMLRQHGLFWMAWVVLICDGVVGIHGATNTIPYSVRIWQTEDGLPQNEVYAITQTVDGYLWVGTHDGLARFDGARFTLVEDPPELKRAPITALCAASDGSLWIGAEGSGVTRLKEGTLSRFSEAEGLSGGQTRCLLETKDGSLWIGSEGGLSRYRGGKIANFTEKDGLGANDVRALAEDPQGNLRIATRRGLSTLTKNGSISTLNVGTGMVANALKAVWADAHENVWVGANEGLTRIEENQKIFPGLNQELPDKVVTVIYGDRAGELWIGTYGGVARMVEGRVVGRPLNEAAFGDLVHTIYEDREGNLWIGGRDGLYRLSPARFSTYAVRQGLTYNNVMSVCEDKSGAIWIGTWGGGLNQIVGEKITAYGKTNGLTGDHVLALHEARDGSLWIGMEYTGGLNRFRPNERWNSFSKESGPVDQIRVIHEDRQGSLWVGTSVALRVLRDGKMRSYSTANGLAGNLVMAICEDGEGTVWIGTDGGLSRWRAGKFSNFTSREGLPTNAVNAIYEDPEHVLWIGTKGGGLVKMEGGRFTTYTTRQGIFSDEIYEIVEDDSGYFWMSCRNGIFRVRKRDLGLFDRGEIGKLPCISFGKPDGLLTVQCNGVAKPAGWKGSGGKVWFPTIRGVVAVETRIQTNERPPPVVIEEILADKKRVRGPLDYWKSMTDKTPGRALTIPPGRGELEIHYTALSFQVPEKNRFKYRLEGIDSDWIDAGNRREVHYNNIGHGRYEFRVMASNNDGVWNEAGATAALVFLPHFWQTWIFKLSLLLAFGLLLTAWYRFRVARLREIERLRVQIAADLHDDVGARLTKVAMVTELVNRETTPTDRTKPHIENIARTTREVIQAMDEIVWTINPKNDTLDNLANYVFKYAQDYFQTTGIRCRMDLPARLPDYPLPTEDRHNLFMAVKEALNNVLKHAEATEVRIGLSVDQSRLTILVSDNGRGFWPAQVDGKGDGLSNMKERLQRIGGNLVLESEPGKGTRIRMQANGS